MSDEKKVNEYHFTMSAITNADGSENFTIQFNSLVGETETEVITKIDKAKRLLDHVWISNNKKAQEVSARIRENIIKEKTELPKEFN